MDVFKCISDVTELKTNIQAFLAQNVTIEALVDEFKTLEPLLTQALSDCGVSNVSFPILISERIPVSFDFLKCVSDLNELVDELAAVTVDISSGNIVNVIQDLVEVKAYVSVLIVDCSVNSTLQQGRVLAETEEIKVNGILECYSDIENLVPELQKFIAIAKTGVISNIVAEVNVLVTDLQTVVADCQLGTFSELRGMITHLNTLSPINCLTDVSELVNLAQAIVSSFNNSQYEQLIQNLVQFVTTLQQTVTDCTSFNTTDAGAKEMILNNKQGIACAGDYNQLVRKLKSFVTVSQVYEKTQVVNQLNNVFEAYKTMLSTCGIESQRILKIDFFACIGDIENIVALATQTVTDAESFDVLTVVDDVEALVTVVETALVDCASSNMTVTQKQSMDIFECVHDIEFEVRTITDLVEDLKGGNFSDAIAKASYVINLVHPLLVDCGFNETLAMFSDNLYINPEECFFDISSFVSMSLQINKSYAAQNWSQLITDMLFVVERGQKLAGDCFNYDLAKFATNQCFEELHVVAQDALVVVNKISSSNGTLDDLLAIVELVTNLAKEVEVLAGDCGLNMSSLNNGNALVLLSLGQAVETNTTCWDSVKILYTAVLDVLNTTDMMEKIMKLIKVKELLVEVKGNCLSLTVVKEEIKVPETIVSYVQTKALRM